MQVPKVGYCLRATQKYIQNELFLLLIGDSAHMQITANSIEQVAVIAIMD